MFKEILGHEKERAALKALAASGRVPPAMIFYGQEGIGKRLAAMEFAAGLNCAGEPADEGGLFGAEGPAPREPGKACGKCPSCVQLGKNVHPDCRLVDAAWQAHLLGEDEEKQRSVKIDTVRELSRSAYSSPILSPWKVFVVNDASSMTVEAQNAILKMLEEPPPDTAFILIASNKAALLPTILSRCHTVNFRGLARREVAEILGREGLELSEADNLAGLAFGSVKRALDLRAVLEKLSDLNHLDPMAPFRVADKLGRELATARETARLILNILVTRAAARWRAAADPEKTSLTRLLDRLFELKRCLARNASPAVTVETAVMECAGAGISLRNLERADA